MAHAQSDPELPEDLVLSVERCHPEARLPARARPGDAGLDLQSCEEVLLKPGETRAVRTGLRLAIPEGFEAQIRPRSGLSLHTPLRIPNAPGTIDSGFRDELCVLLQNTSRPCVLRPDDGCLEPLATDTRGNVQGTYRIRPGDRIAQMVLARLPDITLRPVESVADLGQNRGGGFGHTGTGRRGHGV